MESCPTRKIVVIKLGGSVLTNEDSYRQAARFLVRRLHACSRERFAVVVSAQNGHTDELETLARRVTSYPNPRTLDLLWSTGELRSVALLTLHLEALGVGAVGLNAHEAGLRFNESGIGEKNLKALATELHVAFCEHSVVVVPGFFATLASGTLVSLGRGGSDLSAVLLADELEAESCELIKDVGGYFDEDPHSREDAAHLPQVSYQRALQMADAGCELVQRRALEAARHARLRLVLRSLHDLGPASVVSEDAVEA